MSTFVKGESLTTDILFRIDYVGEDVDCLEELLQS